MLTEVVKTEAKWSFRSLPQGHRRKQRGDWEAAEGWTHGFRQQFKTSATTVSERPQSDQSIEF